MDDSAENLLIVLAEDPVPGKVQERLAAALGEARAAALHAAFLADAISAARRARTCDVAVALAPGSSGAWLDRAAPDVPRWNQRGASEAARQHGALAEAVALGYRHAALLLPSTPLVTPSWIDDAFAALAQHDACLAADQTGGYAWFGLRGAPPAGVLNDLPYGTDALIARLETRLWVLGLRFARLPDLPAVRSSNELDALRRSLLGMPRELRPAATSAALGVGD